MKILCRIFVWIVVAQWFAALQASGASGVIGQHAERQISLPVRAVPTSVLRENAAQAIAELKKLINANDYVGFNNYLTAGLSKSIHQHEIPAEPIVGFLVDLWEGRTQRHPALNWGNANSDQIRVVVALELLIAVRDWGVRYDTAKVHQFVRAKALDDRPMVSLVALNALAIKADPMDVPLLAQIASNHDTGMYRSAADALGWICDEVAERALGLLARNETVPERRQVFLETIERFYPKSGENPWCR